MNEELMRVADVAAQLGLSERLLRRWIAAGRLPVVRFLGVRAVRVPASAVAALVEARNTTGAQQGNGHDDAVQ